MFVLSTHSRLPVELLDQITDHLALSSYSSSLLSFLRDLKALSLTHSVFLGRTRRHLFRKVRSYEGPRLKGRAFPELLAFLAGAPQQLRAAVREVVIDGSMHCSQFTDRSMVGEPTIGKTALRKLLGYLPKLESLTLMNIALADVVSPMSASGWHTAANSSRSTTTSPSADDEDGTTLAGIGSRSLSRFELRETCSVNASPADYLAMLAPFCAIDTLCVQDCYWADEGDSPSKAEGRDIPETGPASVRALGVRRLELDVGGKTLIWLDLISRTRTMLGSDLAGNDDNREACKSADGGPTLRFIAVTCNTVREVRFLGGFLEIAGRTVHEVEIDLGRLYESDTDEEPENDTVLARALKLSESCPNLQGLTFCFTTRLFEEADSPEGGDLCDTLMQLLSYPSSQPPFCLDRVTLRVYCYPKYSMTAALNNITRLLNRIAPRIVPASSLKSSHPPIRNLVVIFEVPPRFGTVNGGIVQSLQFWMDVNMAKEEVDGGMAQCVRERRVEVQWVEVPDQTRYY